MVNRRTPVFSKRGREGEIDAKAYRQAGRDAGELAHDELKVALCLGLLLTLRWRSEIRTIGTSPKDPSSGRVRRWSYGASCERKGGTYSVRR
jgi:hypothetical protein